MPRATTPPQGIGILGVLRGAPMHPERSHREALAGSLLGFALGAQIDLDRSDSEILAMCELVIATIRRVKDDRESMSTFEDAQAKALAHLPR